jgi:hypothetical protein
MQDQIINEFNSLVKVKATESVTSIRKMLAAKYGMSLTTIRRILAKETPKVTSSRAFVITGWELRVKPDGKFTAILENIARHYKAELYVTSLNEDEAEFIPEELGKFKVLTEDLEFNSNFQFKYVQTKALSASPINGWNGIFKHSTIIPGLIKDLKTEKSTHLCRQIMSSGSIGYLNAEKRDYDFITDAESRKTLDRKWKSAERYKVTKAFIEAERFTKPTALIIEIKDDKVFFCRYITMTESGVVYDRNLKFEYGKSQPEISRPLSLIAGDFHSYYTDEANLNALKNIALEYQPESLGLNDFYEGAATNRHLWDDFGKILKMPTLAEEKLVSRKHILELASFFKKVYYLISNHDNFLVKYLANENQYRYNRNYLDAIELRAWAIRNNRHPIIKYLELDTIENLEVIDEGADFQIAENYIMHGHVGLGGARSGFRALAKVYDKMICGHFHSPNIIKNAVCVGTSSKLQMEYNLGAGDWLHSHALIQPDGNVQLLNVINGEYKV